jgi:hypothetical protein
LPRSRLPSHWARAGWPPAADDGTDETLIRWMLSLTPTERLQWAQDMADTVEALREGRERPNRGFLEWQGNGVFRG